MINTKSLIYILYVSSFVIFVYYYFYMYVFSLQSICTSCVVNLKVLIRVVMKIQSNAIQIQINRFKIYIYFNYIKYI